MSNDATCPNCGADNLDDYPVCAACAIKCHFPARETCRHCAAAASLNNLVIDYDLSVQPATDRDTRIRDTAPEMYEALQMFLAYNDQGGPLHFDTDAMWAKARSVMAKIDGGGE